MCCNNCIIKLASQSIKTLTIPFTKNITRKFSPLIHAEYHQVLGVVVWPLLLKWGLGWEMLGDISYHKATLQSEGKQSIHIHIHIHIWKNKEYFITTRGRHNFGVKIPYTRFKIPLCSIFLKTLADPDLQFSPGTVAFIQFPFLR